MSSDAISSLAVNSARRAQRAQGAFVKSLSANDTGLTKSHQAGFLVNRYVGRRLFSFLDSGEALAARSISIKWMRSGVVTSSTARWYSSKSEYRVTGSIGSLITPSMTGDLLVMTRVGEREFEIATFEREVDIEYIRRELEISPTAVFALVGDHQLRAREAKVFADYLHMLDGFPSTSVLSTDARRIYDRVYGNQDLASCDPDKRLIGWVDIEFRLFQEIERAMVYPEIQRGFRSIEDFIALANQVKNRRASRAGASLENHIEQVLSDNNVRFSAQAVTELRKRPDFLFPSAEAYKDANFPDVGLTMLAVKTTCKDRWRQVNMEANRIQNKHLLTLQQGISPAQLAEMKDAGISLVVPKPLHGFYAPENRPELWTLKRFITYVRSKETA